MFNNRLSPCSPPPPPQRSPPRQHLQRHGSPGGWVRGYLWVQAGVGVCRVGYLQRPHGHVGPTQAPLCSEKAGHTRTQGCDGDVLNGDMRNHTRALGRAHQEARGETQKGRASCRPPPPPAREAFCKRVGSFSGWVLDAAGINVQLYKLTVE